MLGLNKMAHIKPTDKEAISEYFDKAIDWSDGMRNSHATGTVLSELKDIFDCDNQTINDELEWWERQKSTLESYKTKDDLKELIKERLGMEIYSVEHIEGWDEEDKPTSEEIESTAEYWSIGKSDEYKYKTEDSFINDVEWDFVFEKWITAWDKVCQT